LPPRRRRRPTTLFNPVTYAESENLPTSAEGRLSNFPPRSRTQRRVVPFCARCQIAQANKLLILLRAGGASKGETRAGAKSPGVPQHQTSANLSNPKPKEQIFSKCMLFYSICDSLTCKSKFIFSILEESFL